MNMKYVDVFELMKKRDIRVLKDKELFRKSQLIDKIVDLVINEKIISENRVRRKYDKNFEPLPFLDDKRYAELYAIEKKAMFVAETLDRVDEIVKSKFGESGEK